MVKNRPEPNLGHQQYLVEKDRCEIIIDAVFQQIMAERSSLSNGISSPEDIPLDAADIYTFLQKGETEGLFILSSPACQYMLIALKPASFEDLLLSIALSATGHFEHGISKTYLDCTQTKYKAPLMLAALEPILAETNGCIVYIEQITTIAEQLAGYDNEEAKQFLRVLRTKRLDELAVQFERFKRALQPKLPTDDSLALFEWMEAMAGAAIRKETLIRPASIAYRMAWLKVHYPKAFAHHIKAV